MEHAKLNHEQFLKQKNLGYFNTFFYTFLLYGSTLLIILDIPNS